MCKITHIKHEGLLCLHWSPAQKIPQYVPEYYSLKRHKNRLSQELQGTLRQ